MTTIWPDPARPGGPLNPEQRGWHWFSCQNMPFLVFWNGEVLQDSLSGQRIKPDVLSPVYSYLGPCLTPTEVEARIATARKDGMKDAAKWHEVRSMELSGKAGVARNFRQLLRQSDFHMESAAEIRALKGQGDD